MRNLVESISHTFNNVLMGIWGNATLIRMKSEGHDPVVAQLLRMEERIESGACLIHMVLGYLGERRTAAQRVRLDQIVQETKKQDDKRYGAGHAHDLKQCLQWAATIQQPQMIAGSTAKVMDILFDNLNARRIELGAILRKDRDIQRKIERMDALILKGRVLVEHLLVFAGDIKPVKARGALKPLLTDVLRRCVDPYADLDTDLAAVLNTLPHPCDIYMDRVMVSAALRTLFSYAIHARNRTHCSGTHPSRLSSISITHGTGESHGQLIMTTNTGQANGEPCAGGNPLEPFALDHQNRFAHGIELAAAWAVISAHGGLILELQKNGQAGTMQILLPIAAPKPKRSFPDAGPRRCQTEYQVCTT